MVSALGNAEQIEGLTLKIGELRREGLDGRDNRSTSYAVQGRPWMSTDSWNGTATSTTDLSS